MAINIEGKVINALLDLYENSKTFIGQNKTNQNFKVSPSKLFKKYDDDAEYDFYKNVNSHLTNLENKNFVFCKKEKSGKVKEVFLNYKECDINLIYDYVGRKNKHNTNDEIFAILEKFEKMCFDEENFAAEKNLTSSENSHTPFTPLLSYIKNQKENILQNKSILFFNGDIAEFKDVLFATKEILQNSNEILIRELSVKLFNNSKRLEELENKIRSLLYKYGEYDDKDTVFEEHNIIKTPTYVMLKGKGIIDAGQKIDLSKINGDLGFSTQTLRSIKNIDLQNADIITIENLTTFYKFQKENALIIYLGGFSNSTKKDFIKLVAKCNSISKFFHFGDIDAGGFYILENLKAKTNIEFVPLNMDIKTLLDHKQNWLPLTTNDKTRLNNLKEKYEIYEEIVDFMLENNCKLEQEAI